MSRGLTATTGRGKIDAVELIETEGTPPMAYANINFPSGKALKEAIKNGDEVRVMSAGMFPPKENGTEVIEGPWYPQPHKFWVRVEVKDGVIVKAIK
jgi:hypothetical protein